jgi:type I pantothenate kinase
VTSFDEWNVATWRQLLPIDAPVPADLADRPDLAATHAPLAALIDTLRTAHHVQRRTVAQLLDEQVTPVPYLVGVTGGVAAGKSVTATTLQSLLRDRGDLSVEVVTTDGFLLNNRELEQRGLMPRKGFPESYDHDGLLSFVVAVKSGDEVVEAPLYDHATYDVVADRTHRIARPDVVILEGLNVLQLIPPGRVPGADGAASDLQVSDFLDFSVYVDADEADLERWYHERLARLRAESADDGAPPGSFYASFASLSDEEFAAMADQVWATVNHPNIVDHVRPTRARADLILEKAGDHSVRRIRMRRR